MWCCDIALGGITIHYCFIHIISCIHSAIHHQEAETVKQKLSAEWLQRKRIM